MKKISEEDVKLVTKHLKLLRQAMNWTQEDLANHIGVTRQTVTAIESGKKLPSTTMVLTILYLFLNIVITVPIVGKVIKSLLETTGIMDIQKKLINQLKEEEKENVR